MKKHHENSQIKNKKKMKTVKLKLNYLITYIKPNIVKLKLNLTPRLAQLRKSKHTSLRNRDGSNLNQVQLDPNPNLIDLIQKKNLVLKIPNHIYYSIQIDGFYTNTFHLNSQQYTRKADPHDKHYRSKQAGLIIFFHKIFTIAQHCQQ